MKQVNFLNKIVTSYFEHIINYANRLLQLTVKLCTVTRAEHAGLIRVSNKKLEPVALGATYI